MKQKAIDKFSKTGRMRARLEELVRKVSDRELSRMEAGDQIGAHIVANLAALPSRGEDDNRLLFEAQSTRASLYHQSEGATCLEAAESLVEARAVLTELADDPELLASLATTAEGILQDLRAVNSRRNSWSVFQVWFDAVSAGGADAGQRQRLVKTLGELSERLVQDGLDFGLLDVVLRMCEWARVGIPEEFPRLAGMIPWILRARIDQISTATVLKAWLYARPLDVAVDPELRAQVAWRLMQDDRREQEARSVYKEQLDALDATEKQQLESAYEKLAYVNPDPDLASDPDLEALNHLLSEAWPESVWTWRNRALLYRRRNDPVAATVCLARAMSISGEPPAVMGLLAPVIAGMGFVQTAFQFSRFMPDAERKRYHLEVLDLLTTRPRSEGGRLKLLARLEETSRRPALPREFQALLRRRRADLAFEANRLDECRVLLEQALAGDPTDELSAVRLAEIEFREGRSERASQVLEARFTARVRPLAEYLRSRILESHGEAAAALRANQAALDAMPSAQEAGREHLFKAMLVVRERVIRMIGQEHADGPLLAMLQVEAHAPRHEDLDLLLPVLERRSVDLAMQSGDSNQAQDLIKHMVATNPGDTDIFVEGIRASLRCGKLADAKDFAAKAEQSGHVNSANYLILRALMALEEDDLQAAREWIGRSMERVPTAEARLFRAALLLREGLEKDALTELEGLREEEGGTLQVRGRIRDLAGRLAERQGDVQKALGHYLAATEEDSGWTDARRRAGLILVDRAIAPGGAIADRAALERGVALLAGFNDSESVLREALGRATLSAAPAEALSILDAALLRTGGTAWLEIQSRRVGILLEQGDHEAARRALESMRTDVAPDAALAAQIDRSLAAIIRKETLDRASTLAASATTEMHSLVDRMEEADRLDPDPKLALGTATLARAAGRTGPKLELDAATPRSLALAVSLVGGERRAKRAKAGSTKDRRNAEPGAGTRSLVGRLLDRISDPSVPAGELLDCIESFAENGVALPYGRGDLMRLAAARSVAQGDHVVLDRILAEQAEGLDDYRILGRILALTSGGEQDPAKVLGLFSELERLAGNQIRDVDRQCSLRIREKVTELKETASPAWASARLRTGGKRVRMHHPAVLAYWDERTGTDGDGEAIRQATLMRLAMAFDAVAAGNASIDEHQKLHASFERMIAHDGLWKRLHAGLSGPFSSEVAAAAVERVRAALPRWLVEAELKLAKRRLFNGDVNAAVQHARIAVRSPLAARLDQAKLQDEVFSALSGELEKHLHQQRFVEAIACIDPVIVADPGNAIARREMIRISARAIERNLSVIDALISPPDRAMTLETCNCLARVLSMAQSSIEAQAKEPPQDRAALIDLAIGLRAIAFVAWHRDHDAQSASQHLDLAIVFLDGVGLEGTPTHRFRAEVGLARVEREIGGEADHGPRAGDDDPVQRAIEEVDRLIVLDPRNVRIVAQKVRLLVLRDRDEEAEVLARELFQEAQKRGDSAQVRAAVELLHQIRSGRERMRYESRMEMVERAIEQRNWRVALDLLKEAIVGRESEPLHIRRQIEIQLGLHRLDKVESLLEGLADCRGFEEDHRRFSALNACLGHILDRGGDAVSVWELMERGEFEKAQALAGEMLARKDSDFLAQLLAALCHDRNGQVEKAKAHARAALKLAKSNTWAKVMLEGIEK